jgi:hypothetical protein
MTAPATPTPPTKGGSFIRDADGRLKPNTQTPKAPANVPAKGKPAKPAKEA